MIFYYKSVNICFKIIFFVIIVIYTLSIVRYTIWDIRRCWKWENKDKFEQSLKCVSDSDSISDVSHGNMYLLPECTWMVKSFSQSFTKLRAFNELRKQRFISTYIFSCYLSLFSFFRRFSILIFRNSLWFCCFSSDFLSGFPHKHMWTRGKGAACLYEDINSGCMWNMYLLCGIGKRFVFRMEIIFLFNLKLSTLIIVVLIAYLKTYTWIHIKQLIVQISPQKQKESPTSSQIKI